jgi:glycosyltransferase involved in cell wall biosynthesis
MKLTFVTPRYGKEVVGGAEGALRILAQRLAERGHSVRALSTCALDHLSWANELPEGSESLDGVEVVRFSTDYPRDLGGLALDTALRKDPRNATSAQCEEWLRLNGPVSTGLLDAIGDERSDAVIFSPYLYHPIAKGIERASVPRILHGAGHDEAFLYFPFFGDLFRTVDGINFYTHAESALVNRVHHIATVPQHVGGIGIDEPLPRQRRGQEIVNLGDRPYLVCVGRVDPHKGSTLLFRYFVTYKERHPGPLALVFVGPLGVTLPTHKDVVVAGMLSDQDRDDVVRDAFVSVSPSALESFGLVLPEAWRVGVPVLVHGLCGATRELTQRGNAGLWFEGYSSFEVALERLTLDPTLAPRLGAAGKRYVDEVFNWTKVLERYEGFLQSVCDRRR